MKQKLGDMTGAAIDDEASDIAEMTDAEAEEEETESGNGSGHARLVERRVRRRQRPRARGRALGGVTSAFPLSRRKDAPRKRGG